MSDAFENEPDKDLGLLNLQVPVYNINKGMNDELFNKSPHLKQYAEFVAKLREFTTLHENYADAVRETVGHCIANNVLAEFLRKEGGQVVSVLTAEFDLDTAKRVWRNEQMEEFAITMLANDEPIEKIIMYTGLTPEEIKDLQGG